ncbi:hypothetical protein PFFVO_03978 [Plasmodium falciparum Vietnam Oak-Knoll (FVO)]|uniref:Clu domain-containing protein n=1 Tax=Plasmodium falciparum Vietnam Oak-Knoll (FVO) TaxID=1036723 RepID=A0A024V3T7_PLAFA|nr:hypothetical protein PFFVO_03978 [Plasmodium falciparum Vietnam Oak-Knoll (FVO)]
MTTLQKKLFALKRKNKEDGVINKNVDPSLMYNTNNLNNYLRSNTEKNKTYNNMKSNVGVDNGKNMVNVKYAKYSKYTHKGYPKQYIQKKQTTHNHIKRIIRKSPSWFSYQNFRNILFLKKKSTIIKDNDGLNVKIVVKKNNSINSVTKSSNKETVLKKNTEKYIKKVPIQNKKKELPKSVHSTKNINNNIKSTNVIKNDKMINVNNGSICRSNSDSNDLLKKNYVFKINKPEAPYIQEFLGKMKDDDSILKDKYDNVKTEREKKKKVIKKKNIIIMEKKKGNYHYYSDNSTNISSNKIEENMSCSFPASSQILSNNNHNNNNKNNNDICDDDNIESNSVDYKIKIYNNLMENIKPTRSYQLDISHPLYNSLCKNELSYLSSNWHDRINFAFRNIWALSDYMYDEKSEGEREKEFFNELELFHASSNIGACGLVYSLFVQNIEDDELNNYLKKCFVQINKENYPHIYKIYKPKFEDDLIFLFDSIVFTIVLGSTKDNINYNIARKIYNNDLKGKMVLCDCIYNLKRKSKFCLPIANQIDFMGMRIIAEPLIPLNEQYIPIDIIKDIYEHTDMNDYMSDEDRLPSSHVMDNTSNKMNDKRESDHFTNNEYGDNYMDMINNTCVDKNEIHMLCTNKLNSIKRKKKSKENDQFYGKIMLEIEKYDIEFSDQLKQMSHYINYDCCILPIGISNYFELNILKNKNNVKIYKSIIDNLYFIRGTEEILPPFLLLNMDKENYITRLRYEFIKYYYEKPLCNTTKSINIKYDEYKNHNNNIDKIKEATKECINNIDNYIIPKISNFLLNFSDSYDITQVYHSHGININKLGYLLKKEIPDYLSEMVCRELIARTLKCIYYEHIHSFIINHLKNGTIVKNISNQEFNNVIKGKDHGMNNYMDNNTSTTCSNNEINNINNDNNNNNNNNREYCLYSNTYIKDNDHYNLINDSNACCQSRNKKGKMIFSCLCKKCISDWNYFPELTPHKLLIRLINLTLNINTLESLTFWNNILIPDCIKKYNINLNEYINIKDIEIYGLLLCIEYHMGISFTNECKQNYKIKLPLTLNDMSTFSTKKDVTSFPNIYSLKNIFSSNINLNLNNILQNNYVNDNYNNMNHLISKDNKYKYKNNLNSSSFNHHINKLYDNENINNQIDNSHDEKSFEGNNFSNNTNNQTNLKNVYLLLEDMIDDNILSQVGDEINKYYPNKYEQNENTKKMNTYKKRGNQLFDNCNNYDKQMYFERNHFSFFYPKSKICLPLYCTWYYKNIEKLYSNILLQEKFKIKNNLKENIVDIIGVQMSNFLSIHNISTVGTCSKIKSFIYEYNIPCHPYCILNEKMKCINYVRSKKAIYLLLNFNINKNVLKLAKIFLHLAYIHFEHGYIEKCLKVCYYIYNNIPSIGTIKRDILILTFQCKLKEEKIQDALLIYKLITQFSKYYDGEYNISTLWCNILLMQYYYDKANATENEGIKKRNDIDIEDKKDCYEKYDNRNMMYNQNIMDLKRKYLINALYYSKRCYHILSSRLNDICFDFIYIFSLIMLGNILMSLNKFAKAIKYYNLSLQYCIKGKIPTFLLVQNKCLLAECLKKNGNVYKAVELAEECLQILHTNSNTYIPNLDLYIILKLAQMKEYIGCKDLITYYPYISLKQNSCNNNIINKKICLSDFINFEQKYLNEKNIKYRNEAINLYIILYEKLKNKKNYAVVNAKDIFGNFYIKDDITYNNNKTEINMNNDDIERIYELIKEILKIKVISLCMNKQIMFASKLLAIVLSKNSSPFINNLTLMKDKNRNRNILFNNKYNDDGDEDIIKNVMEKNENKNININNLIYNDILLNNINHHHNNINGMLNYQLSHFHLNKQKKFFEKSCYTKDYDYISVEKILFDHTYFEIEDICKYCYLKCDDNINKCTNNEMNYSLNPSIWFDILFFNVMKGTCNNKELIVLIDLFKIFLTPMQKQLILYHIKSLHNINNNDEYSEYIQYLLNREKTKFLHFTNVIDQNFHTSWYDNNNKPEHLSNFDKKDIIKNIDLLSNIRVTNPNLYSC